MRHNSNFCDEQEEAFMYLLKEDFMEFPIGDFPYDKNH